MGKEARKWGFFLAKKFKNLLGKRAKRDISQNVFLKRRDV